MAFAVASKGAPLAGLLKNLRLAAPSSSLLGPASIFATRRVYSTGGGAPYYYEASIGDELVLYHHQLLACHFFHPMFTFIPFHPMFTFIPAAAAARMWWVSKQDEDAVEVKVAMPGLPAERVKVWTNQKGLFIKGEGVKGPDDVVQDPAPYSCHIELSADSFDLDKAKAEMKHGLLKVTVPRVKGFLTEIKVESLG